MAQTELGPDAVVTGERGTRPHVSLIIPVFNEERTVREVYRRSAEALDADGRPYEIIVIDDGSTDGTWAELEAIHAMDSTVRAVRFKRNFGQHPAICRTSRTTSSGWCMRSTRAATWRVGSGGRGTTGSGARCRRSS